MQTIYGDASNIYLTAQKRLIRVVYGQTQATPYACVLDPSLRDSEGTIIVPKAEGEYGNATKRDATAFSLKGSIVPGTVLAKTAGEYVTVAGAKKESNERPFGLLGQWVGGTFDNIKQSNQVAAWQGFDAVIDLIKPAFNTTAKSSEGKGELAALLKTAGEKGNSAETRVLLYADENGLLSPITEKEISKTAAEKGAKIVAVAEAVELVNSNVLRIKLLV